MDPKQVQLIFKETYNFYLRWKNVTNSHDDDIYKQMTSEARELSEKYGHAPLVLHITVELANILEQEWRNAEKTR